MLLGFQQNADDSYEVEAKAGRDASSQGLIDKEGISASFERQCDGLGFAFPEALTELRDLLGIARYLNSHMFQACDIDRGKLRRY